MFDLVTIKGGLNNQLPAGANMFIVRLYPLNFLVFLVEKAHY